MLRRAWEVPIYGELFFAMEEKDIFIVLVGVSIVL